MKNDKEISIAVGRALEALRILERLAASPYPARAAYRIGRLVARLQMNPDVIAAEKTRQEVVRKLGVEKDGQISVPADKLQCFSDEYGSVAAVVVELDIVKLPVSVFEDGPYISPADMVILQDFVEED